MRNRGLGFVLCKMVFPVEYEPAMPRDKRIDARHKYYLPLLLSAPVIFVIFLIGTHLNPIYVSIIAMILGGRATWYCRRDLMKVMLASAVLFLRLYTLSYLTLIALFPGYFDRFWDLSVLSGILVTGIPVQELLFAFAFGIYRSTVYQHFNWKKVPVRTFPGITRLQRKKDLL